MARKSTAFPGRRCTRQHRADINVRMFKRRWNSFQTIAAMRALGPSAIPAIGQRRMAHTAFSPGCGFWRIETRREFLPCPRRVKGHRTRQSLLDRCGPLIRSPRSWGRGRIAWRIAPRCVSTQREHPMLLICGRRGWRAILIGRARVLVVLTSGGVSAIQPDGYLRLCCLKPPPGSDPV